MDKKTILKVFGEAFLRSMVVLMAIVIIGFSVFFIIKVRSDKKLLAEQQANTEAGSTYSDEELQAMLDAENANDTKEDASTEETTTEEVTTEEATTEQVPSNDKNIVVLNSTKTNQLAKKWQTKLSGAGFANVAAGNYTAGAEAQTIIYVKEEGMGQDLAAYFADAVIQVGAPDASSCSVTIGNIALGDADIIIVVGNSDTTVQ